jgi:AcrR family transcriptional regulator
MTIGHIMPLRARSRQIPPKPARNRRERRKEEVRRRLFRAAVHLFGTRGFEASTVEDITRAADVGKGTFFNYFRTKEMLLSEWAEQRLDILRAARADMQHSDASVRAVLRRLFFEVLEEPTRSHCTARCMLVGLLGNEPIAGMVQGTAARAGQILTDIMAEGQRRGEIRRDATPADLAQLFQRTFFGFMHMWVLMPRQSLSRRRHAAFELFWAAAAVPPGRARESTK